jgi:hypothetical protein
MAHRVFSSPVAVFLFCSWKSFLQTRINFPDAPKNQEKQDRDDYQKRFNIHFVRRRDFIFLISSKQTLTINSAVKASAPTSITIICNWLRWFICVHGAYSQEFQLPSVLGRLREALFIRNISSPLLRNLLFEVEEFVAVPALERSPSSDSE